jgi:topoisomerase-4 subunit A
VIYEGRPQFLAVDEILKINTNKTVDLLRLELEIRKNELEEQWHFASLEKIFIEKRIYRKIEECETWESVIETIDNGLRPFKKLFKREITRDDILKLTEIKIKRISKFNSFQADEHIKGLEVELEEVQNHLAHLIEFAINYYRQIKKKFGKDKDRKTEIRNFDTIEATMVAVANEKLYVNREEGFAGIGLKKDEYVCDCSDIDDIIVFREDGTCLVTKVVDKVFVGKNIIHIDVFRRNDDRTIYNMIYRDGRGGKNFVKRFAVVGVTRDKEYNLTKGTEGSKVLYFSANPNGEAEIVRVNLKPKPKMKITTIDFNFSELAIKGRNSLGNTLTKNVIKKIVKKEEGVSTLGAMDIWYDESVKRLNAEGRGRHLGAFMGDDKILTIMQSGEYRLTGFDLTTHFDDDLIEIRKFDPSTIVSAVYLEGSLNLWYLKRFQVEATDKKTLFIGESAGSRLITLSMDERPLLQVVFDEKKNGKTITVDVVNAEEFIGVKSYKAKGKRLSTWDIKEVNWLKPLPVESMEDQSDELPGDETEEPDLFEQDENGELEDISLEPEDLEVEVPEEENEIKEEQNTSFFPNHETADMNLSDEQETESVTPKKTVTRKPRRKDEDEGTVQMSLF